MELKTRRQRIRSSSKSGNSNQRAKLEKHKLVVILLHSAFQTNCFDSSRLASVLAMDLI